MTHFTLSICQRLFIISLTLLFLFGCDNRSSDISSKELYVWSHNDYEQEQPLFTALDVGYQMIEADIHLIEGRIYVIHDHPEDLENTPLLDQLYLFPLEEIIKKNGGAVLPESSLPFYLIIDIKTEAESTYNALTVLLDDFKELFYRKEGGEWIDGPIRLLISGNRPALSTEASDRIGFLDGRISDIGQGHSPELYPLISDNWNNFFSWDGTGEIPDEELNKIREYVSSAHQEDKMIRFWATPDREELWRVFIDNGVDVINVDDLSGMRKFLDREYPNIEM